MKLVTDFLMNWKLLESFEVTYERPHHTNFRVWIKILHKLLYETHFWYF